MQFLCWTFLPHATPKGTLLLDAYLRLKFTKNTLSL